MLKISNRSRTCPILKLPNYSLNCTPLGPTTITNKINKHLIKGDPTSTLADFHAGSLSWWSWNLETLDFVEGGKAENPEKNPGSNTGINPHMAPVHRVRIKSQPHQLSENLPPRLDISRNYTPLFGSSVQRHFCMVKANIVFLLRPRKNLVCNHLL